MDNDLTLSDIIKLPGVLETKDTLIDPLKIWPGLEKNIKRALVGLENMRKREGKSLSADVKDKLKRMLLQIKKIKARSKIYLSDKKKKSTPEEFKAIQKVVISTRSFHD